MSDSETDIRLRPAVPEDRFRIRRWLAEPEIAAWWGNAASAEAEIALAMASDTAVCRIVLFGEEPIGYAHAVDVGLWGGERPQEIEPGTWDVDLFIGSEQHRSRGLGGVALGAARGGGVCHDAGGGVLRARVDQERGRGAGLRAGGLRLAADLERPAARPMLADGEGSAEPAARSLSWPAATRSRETVSTASPATSSSVALTRCSRPPCSASQASTPPLRRSAARVKAACAASSWLSA